MQEHPSTQQLALYQSRALAPDLFLSIHRHISTCPRCDEQCNAESRVKQDYAILLSAVMPNPDEPAYHLTKEEVVGYAKNNLDDVASELAESHIAVCAQCAEAAQTLRSATSSYSFAPGAQSRGHQTIAGVLTARARPLRVAAVVLLALGAVLLAVLFMRTREGQPAGRNETANVNTSKRDTVPASSPADKQLGQSGTSVTGEQKPPHSEKQPRQTESTAAGSGLSASGSDKGPEADVSGVVSPSLRRAIRSALTTQRLERPKVLAELSGTSGKLLSESADGPPFELLSPVGQVVQGLRPRFRWARLAGASSYVVTVTDNKLDEVVTSEPLTETEWGAPVSLRRGAKYSWQVTALKDGKRITSPVMPAPQAKFKILDRKQSEELSRMKRAMPNYHIGLGVLYAHAGLLEEAEREFQAQLKVDPHSAVAENLLNSVRSMRE